MSFRHSQSTLLAFLALPAIFLAVNPGLSFSADKKSELMPIKVLIVDGYSNHDWPRNTRLIRGLLDSAGLFEVSVSTAPNTADARGWDKWRPRFADYDVVIQTCNDLPGGSNPKTPGPQWPPEVQKAFEEYVASGGGVFIYHSGNNAFANWPAYNDIIGLGWRDAQFGKAISLDEAGNLHTHEPGDGERTGHGRRLDTVVHRRGQHAIHNGFPEKWMAAELEVYYFARGPAKNLEVISFGYDQKTKRYWPIEWTVRYGKGRVYNSSYGHVWKDQQDPPNIRDAAFQTIMPRALQWLAKREVTYPIPADFPGADKPSLRVVSNAKAANGEVQLFNGKDLTGWGYKTGEKFDGKTESDDKRFTAKDGMIVVNPGTGIKQLWTTAQFPKDFELRLEFRAAVNADSGLFIRKPQLQVRDYLVAGPYKQLKKYKAQDWNEIVVVVKGNVAHCTCNGEILEEALKIPDRGGIGLEADRGQMEYRNIRLRQAP